MTQPSKPPMVLGVIVGNRGFFPDHLARSGRQEMLSALTAQGIKPIALGESDSKHGAVETRQEAARCADLFKKHREEIEDRKSTRLNSSHLGISYAVFCLKKKNYYISLTIIGTDNY